jgi:large subunit ribosomal protein L25
MAKAKATGQQVLTVKRRTARGSRPARRLRREGLVPGVVYGRGTEPLAISISQRELSRLLHARKGEHALVTLRLQDLPAPAASHGEAKRAGAQAGGGAWEKPAIVQAVQHDPVNGCVTHVDFHAIVLTERLKVKVPLVLTGEPLGVKQEGGVLEHFLREVEVECLPTEIPASIEHDVSAMKIGDTVHVRDLLQPKHVRILSDPESVIASVQAPKAEAPAEEAAAAVAEPEVIREKKEPGEAAAGEEGSAEKPSRVAGEAKKEK